MKGILVTHYFEENADSLSGPELYELQDENGLTIWFSRPIFRDVCISGTCKMIRLWLFWDGAGDYLGMLIPENEPLTKSDHSLFAPSDYKKLDTILQDTASILKNVKQEDLIIIPDTINPFEVDGFTAATQPTLAEVVVEEAAYTCHTLWHTVYGPVQDTIKGILNTRINENYLKNMFRSPKEGYALWAINALKKYPEYHHNLYPLVLDKISSDQSVLSKKALNYFNGQFLSDTALQVQLVKVMTETGMNGKYEILWKLIGCENINETAVLNLLNMFINEKIDVGAYNLILRMVNTEHMKNEQIAGIMQSLSKNENSYIRNLTIKKLSEAKN